ncbi:MAG: glutathione S-transferase [Pseudomonadota bacterium]
MPAPVLYTFRRCPYAMRARMALLVSGVIVEHREVCLRELPEQMLAISPKATVPVLELENGTVLDESRDIIDWALQINDPQGWKVPDLESDSTRLIDANDEDFKPHLDRYKYADRHPEHPASQYRTDAEQFLAGLESRLQRTAFLCGPQCTVADIAIFPFVRQFSMVDADWFGGAPYPRLRGWLHAFLESSEFAAVMVKTPEWKAESTVVQFPQQPLHA